MSVGIVDKQTGERIPTAGMPAIDDALDLTSVNPVQNAIITAALANKQDKTDNNLETTDKTVVGAINEHEGDIDSLKSGLTNLSPDHIVLNIEANAYSDYGTALLHLNNAYLQLTNEQKARSYLLVNYDVVFRNTSINAGYFSGIILGYDSAFYEIMAMYDFAHQKVFETSSNGATIEKTSDSQVSSLTLMY